MKNTEAPIQANILRKKIKKKIRKNITLFTVPSVIYLKDQQMRNASRFSMQRIINNSGKN